MLEESNFGFGKGHPNILFLVSTERGALAELLGARLRLIDNKLWCSKLQQ